MAGKLGTLSVIYVIVNSSSSSKLKPTLFPEGGNSIPYVIIVVSQNGVDVIPISHEIKLRRSEL